MLSQDFSNSEEIADMTILWVRKWCFCALVSFGQFKNVKNNHGEVFTLFTFTLFSFSRSPTKIPKPEWGDMMEMLTVAMESTDVDVNEHIWWAVRLHGSEDHLVSRKIFTLVGEAFLDR